MTLNSFKFYNHPIPRAVDQYDNARKKMINYVNRRSDIKSLYEFGSLKAPGLSDLDFAVVLDDKACQDISQFLSIKNIPPLVKQIMSGGTLMVFRSADFVSIAIWDDVAVNLLCGLEHTMRQLSEDEEYYVELCRVVDWLPERCSRLVEIVKTKRVPVQRTVGYLYSTVYSLYRVIRILNQSDVAWNSFIKTVHEIRSLWFSGTPGEMQRMLIEAVFRGIEVSLDTLRLFGEYCVDNHIYNDAPVPKALLKIKDSLEFRFVGHKDVSFEFALAQSRSGEIVIPVPSIFYHHYNIYASVGGRIGNVLRRNLSPDSFGRNVGDIDSNLMRVLLKRMRLANNMAQFLHSNRLHRGLYKLGWYYSYPDDSEEESKLVLAKSASFNGRF